MEKARRIIERDALVKRLATLDERLISIASEQAELHDAVSVVTAADRASPTVHLPAMRLPSHDSFPIQY